MMESFLRWLSRFTRFTFRGEFSMPSMPTNLRVVDIDEANPERQPQSETEFYIHKTEEQIRLQMITRINWLLMGICILSFLFIIVYPFVYPQESTPDIIHNAFFATLGWFGGILGAFFQIDQGKK